VWLQSLPMKRFSRTVFRVAMQGQGTNMAKWYLLGLIVFIITTVFFGGDPGRK